MEVNVSPYRSEEPFEEGSMYEDRRHTRRHVYPSDESRGSGQSGTNYSGSRQADTSFQRTSSGVPSSSRRLQPERSYRDDVGYNYGYSERLVDDGGGRFGYGNGQTKNYDVSWSDEDIIHDYPRDILHRESAATSRTSNLRNDGKTQRGIRADKRRTAGRDKSRGNWQTVTEEEFEREYFGVPNRTRNQNRRSEEYRNVRKISRFEPIESVTQPSGLPNDSIHRTVYTSSHAGTGSGTPKSGSGSRARFADAEGKTSSTKTTKTTDNIRYRRPTRKKGFERRAAEFFEDMFQDTFSLFGCGRGRKSKSMHNLTTSDITIHSAQPTTDHLEKSESSYSNRTQRNFADSLRNDQEFKEQQDYRRRGYRSIDRTGASRCRCCIGRRSGTASLGRRLYTSQSERNLNTASCVPCKCKCWGRSLSRDRIHTIHHVPCSCRCTRRYAFSTPVPPETRLRNAQARSVSYDTGLDREDTRDQLRYERGSYSSLMKDTRAGGDTDSLRSTATQNRGIQTMPTTQRFVQASPPPVRRSNAQVQAEMPEPVTTKNKSTSITTFNDIEPDVAMYSDQVLNFFVFPREEEERHEEHVRTATAAVQTTRERERRRSPEREYRDEYDHHQQIQTIQEEPKVVYSRPVAAVRKEVPIVRQPPPIKKPVRPSEAYLTNLFMKPRISESRSYEMESNTPTPGVREEITVPVLSSQYVPVERPRLARDVQVMRPPESKPPPPPEEEEEEVILETSSIEEKEQRIRMEIREDVEFSMLRTQGGSQVPQIEGPDGVKRSVEPFWVPEKFEAVVDRRKQKSTQVEQTESDGDFHLRREQERLNSNRSNGYEINSAIGTNSGGRNIERTNSGWKSSGTYPGTSNTSFYSSGRDHSRQFGSQDDVTDGNDYIMVEQAVTGNRIPLKLHQETSRESVSTKSYPGPEMISETEVGLNPMLIDNRQAPFDLDPDAGYGNLSEQAYAYGLGNTQVQYSSERPGRRTARSDFDTIATAL